MTGVQTCALPICTGWTCLSASSDGRRLVAGTRGSGAFISNDAGASWSPITAPATNWGSITASVDLSRIVAATDNKIIQSFNSGVTWHQTSAPLGSWTAVAGSSDGSVILAVRSLYGPSHLGSIFVSHDSGTNWTQPSGITGAMAAAWCSPDGNLMFAAINGGNIYTSADSGTHWTVTGAPSSGWRSIGASSNGVFAVASDSGSVWVSTNSGNSWTNTAVPSSVVVCSQDGATVFAGAVQGPIFYSTSSGTTWASSNTPYGAWSALAVSANGNWMAANSEDMIYTAPATPLLFIQRTAGGVNLSWACSLTNYSLQGCDSVISPNWSDLPSNRYVINGLNQVFLPVTKPAAFFRLTSQ